MVDSIHVEYAKLAFGWVATFIIVGGLAAVMVVGIGTAMVGWPLSDPASREAFRAVLLFGGGMIAFTLLIGAAGRWGPLSMEENND